MRIGVIGTGHVGLVTAATLAHLGHTVVGNDLDDEKIGRLSSGSSPFFEPGVEDLMAEEMPRGRLSFTRSTEDTVRDADVVFICVGTPARATGEANLVAVENAAREAAQHATGRMVLVEKSTVPAGTSERVRETLRRERPDLDGELDVASNPEFLREGRAVADSLAPDRILVGAETDWVFEKMREVYAPLVEKGVPLIETDIATAELSKHACNAFLSLKISFANALARLCERAGADVEAVTSVMGHDARIGPAFLKAGLGYGGYCFPKDIIAFQHLAEELGYDFGLLREVARINDEAVSTVASRVKDVLWNLEGKKIAMLGLAFKGGTDDVRFSPAIALARLLIEGGASVTGFDPQAQSTAAAEEPRIAFSNSPYDAATGSDCVIIATDWAEFRDLDLAKLKEEVRHPIVFDGRNLLDADAVEAEGFTYLAVGRPARA